VVKESTMRLALLIVIAPAVAYADVPVVHVPPASAAADANLELSAEAPASSATLTAHYRHPGDREFAKVELVRKGETTWTAIVPAAAVVAPGLEYYLAAGTAAVFASPQAPHEMRVESSASDDRRVRDLARFKGRRYRVRTAGEFVNYGTRNVDAPSGPQIELPDQFYRLDAEFTYRVLAYPLEEMRFGITRLIGKTELPMCATGTRCTGEVGFGGGAWIELGLGLIEGVRFDGRISVAANQEDVAVGGRGELRLGVLDGSHVAAGVEHLADVGTAGFFRLGWGTVPGVPMAATVEVTNLPAATRDVGVRLYYDVARELGGGVRLGARVGYAARNQTVAGFTGGGNVTIDF
jgi:hypothetical protein